MGDNDSIVNNPLFGVMIGQQIGNAAHAAADAIRAKTAYEGAYEGAAQNARHGLIVVNVLNQRIDALRNEVNNLTATEISYTCSIAGVRGVTRELLEELRKSDPNNPLLEKKIRDRIFDSAKIEASKDLENKSYLERELSAEKRRDISYGSEGSSKGGPEKSKITPNIKIRTQAEVPFHISDREKFLGLIERLSAEVKKNNPNAEILKDKVMLEIFSGHPLE